MNQFLLLLVAHRILYQSHIFQELWFSFVTRPVNPLNWCWILMSSVHLKILINLIKCFKLLLITNVSDCGTFKLHLLSDILSLAQILLRFRMQHRELVKDDISTLNDLSFRWSLDSKSFDSITTTPKESLIGFALQLTFTYMIVCHTSKHIQHWSFNSFVRP